MQYNIQVEKYSLYIIALILIEIGLKRLPRLVQLLEPKQQLFSTGQFLWILTQGEE